MRRSLEVIELRRRSGAIDLRRSFRAEEELRRSYRAEEELRRSSGVIEL